MSVNARKLSWVLALLLVPAIVLSAVVLGHHQPDPVRSKVSDSGAFVVGSLPDSAGRDAVKAAVDAIPSALSYDYRKLGAGLTSATSKMTPTFAKQFRTAFATSAQKKATDQQAVTTALVRGAGLVQMDGPDKARCLLYVDQVLVSSNDKKASDPVRVNQNRVRVDLKKVDGTWKVDGLEPF